MRSSLPLIGKTALVTGSSRGIGASVACKLAERGADVAINYRNKMARAQEVAETVTTLGRKALLLAGDITRPDDLQAIFTHIKTAWGKLDLLILNASGGLEPDRAADYAMDLNLHAQVNLTKSALPMMPAGSVVIFVTSHLAHFHRTKPVIPEYEVVASSKKAGEDALRSMIPELRERGVRLTVVSGDLIEGTITPKLLQRRHPGLIARRKEEAGSVPDIEQFAEAIVEAGTNEGYQTGGTIYVGSTD